MTTTCPCGAPVPEAGLWLCRACEDTMIRDLTRVPGLLVDLDHEITRQTAKTPAPGGTSGPPLAFDVAASDIRHDLLAVLTSFETMIPTPTRPPGSSRGRVARIIGARPRIRRRTEITVFARDLADAVRRGVGKVDVVPERVLLGHCQCGALLVGSRGAGWVRCRHCQAAWPVGELLEARREAVLDELADARLRASDMEAALQVLGCPTPAGTIRQWASRGRLVPDEDGRYRVEDALDLAERARLRAA